MDNREIARILEDASILLDIQGANPFRVRAYGQAARTAREHPSSISDLVAMGADLTALDGIGKDMAGHLRAVAETGTFSVLDTVSEAVPRTLIEIVRLPGVGPKRTRTLWQALGVTTLDALQEACEAGRVANLEGFGAKTQAKMLKGIEQARAWQGRARLDAADRVIAPLLDYLKGHDDVGQCTVAGSYRRRKETVGDLDILIATENPTGVVAHFTAYAGAAEVERAGDTRATVYLRDGFQVDLRVVVPAVYGAALQYFTGSKEHNIKVRKRALAQGLSISEYGVFRGEGGPDGGERIAGASEEEVYAAVGLPWIVPELREDHGEVEAAAAGELPDLVTVDDIRGDLQMHTTWSDGQHTVREMLVACAARGYAYCAITDHSQALAMTGGLDEAKLARQWDEMDEVERDVEGIRLLRSLEVDILKDGTLDLDEAWLERLDVVLLAIHSHFALSRTEQTDRLVRALSHPRAGILAHPTGRILGRREPISFDVDEVLKAAKANHVAVECNANPARLDLAVPHLRRAQALGVPVVISTDAHHVDQLAYLRYGVDQARRAGLTRADVLNTGDVAGVLARLYPTA